VIAEAGATITQAHIAQVQKIVKERLEEIEHEYKDQLLRDVEQIKLSIGEARAESDLRMESLRNELEDQSADSKGQNSRMRDELLNCVHSPLSVKAATAN